MHLMTISFNLAGNGVEKMKCSGYILVKSCKDIASFYKMTTERPDL
jgi:hypothetical protein